MGFESEDIIQQLIAFFPIFIRVENFSVVITSLGSSSKNEDDEYYAAEAGFISSFITRYNGAQHLFYLKFKRNIAF